MQTPFKAAQAPVPGSIALCNMEMKAQCYKMSRATLALPPGQQHVDASKLSTAPGQPEHGASVMAQRQNQPKKKNIIIIIQKDRPFGFKKQPVL